ncbi:hypothetical protein FEM48_Zijuj02G0119900 [Ziziphus jujuba var. spinosa]|uniref:Uncharacterized protein n=1 Tax=Ziziphus jujuba var. spinosa TaxID=714518 RepID=A0A978VVL3_ZIZJJ|nr:hypothetical protein FEM48_Zijuj02G0119900 [Ziziphus jujuba var. spinosa]
MKVVKEKPEAGYKKDILLEATENSGLNQEATDRIVVDNCRNVHLVGYEPLQLQPHGASCCWLQTKIGKIVSEQKSSKFAKTMMVALHTDPKIWGPDSYKFNRDRFANRIPGACKLPYL